MLSPENTICFGDSHCEYFKDIFMIQRYDASSAKGLQNKNAITGTNQKIRQCILENPGKHYIFYFGKVDVDFVINYKYNTDLTIDLYAYVDTIIEQYIAFLESLCVSNIIVLELPISHLDDSHILNYMNQQNVIAYINNYMTNKDAIKPMLYKNVIPWEIRNKLILYMGAQLATKCKEREYIYVPVNTYFFQNDGSHTIPDKYIYENRFDDFKEQPHHLGRGISELYMRSLHELGLT